MGLTKFRDTVKSDEAWQQRRFSQPTVNHAITVVEKLLDGPPSPKLGIPQQRWNSIALALEEVGVLVVLADGSCIAETKQQTVSQNP